MRSYNPSTNLDLKYWAGVSQFFENQAPSVESFGAFDKGPVGNVIYIVCLLAAGILFGEVFNYFHFHFHSDVCVP